MKSSLNNVIILIFVFCAACKGQIKAETPIDTTRLESKDEITYGAPSTIVRTVKQDRKGDIWMASWDGVFRYDGQTFTNMTTGTSTARFFSILEDRKGDMWFGSIGSGVYRYDGNFFQNLTTKEGLVNNDIVTIYEDKAGNIWFGGNGGVSRYDGKLFLNYRLNGNMLVEDSAGKFIPNTDRPPHEVNSIVEDRSGKFWFGTRDHTFIYDGKTFVTVERDGKPFSNVRSIIEDRSGNIWLGGNDGLWRYDGSTYTNVSKNFVGYIYEDRGGNIWTSSEKGPKESWGLSRYDEKSLSKSLFKIPTPTDVKSDVKMIFGITEAADGSIWFGTLNGVYRYDGNVFKDFKGKRVGSRAKWMEMGIPIIEWRGKKC